MTRAALFVEGVVIDSISIGQPVTRTKGGRLVGLDPSKPGDPPHVLHGRLRQSITHKVTVSEPEVVALVGTNVEYARYLEFGTERMQARPFLRPAVAKNRREILRRIGRG